MQRIPPPTSFAEGQRLIFGFLVAGAGMFCGAMAIAMVCLLMWGNWPPAEYHTIVVIFGWSLGGFIAAMMVVIVGLLVGGPVGRFKGALDRTGGSVEVSGNETSAGATVTTTTTVEAPPVRIAPETGSEAPGSADNA